MLKHLIRIKLTIARLSEEDDGQGLTEYALILALIVVVAVSALAFLNGSARYALSTIASSIPNS
jgi:Flp pilus assembly pilin Flp